MMHLGKKLLSLLTVFCLTLSLVPTVALAATPSNVLIGESTNKGITLNSNKPYLASCSTNSTDVQPSENTGYIYFDASTGTVELHNYKDQGISWTRGIYVNSGDLTIKLVGTNYIKSGSNGIYSSGKLTISGPGSLTLTSSTNGSTIYAKDTITIQKGANVTSPKGSNGQSIHLDNHYKEIIVTGNGTVLDGNGSSGYGEIRCGNGTGVIQLNDGAKLVAYTTGGKLKINGRDASDDEKKQISQGITADSSTPTYTISGTVTNTSGQGIADANVQLCTADTVSTSALTVINTSTTGSDGTYSFSNVRDGDYTITVEQTEYISAQANIKVNGTNVTKDFTLTPVKQKALTPSATFTATDATTGTLSNVTSEMQYKVGDGAWTNITGDTVSLSDLNVTAGDNLSIQVKKLGSQADNTTDSDPQTIQVTKAATPTGLSATPCTVGKNDGTITGVDTAMEWKPNDSSEPWADVNGTSITGLSSGTYLVRVKANHTVLASENEDVTIDTGYQVWVKDIQVTDANKDDVLGDNSKSVTYTPANGDTPAILTLSNAHITNNQTPPMGGMYYIAPNGITAKEDLKIEVIGTNTIESDHGNPIKATENLTISDSNSANNSLELKSNDNMSALSLDYTKQYNLTISGSVSVTADVVNNVIAALSIAANKMIIQDEAKVTAINHGKNVAVYCRDTLTVQDSATLIAQSENNNHAITAENSLTYPGHIIKASEKFDGSDFDTTYNPAKLNPGVNKVGYKYVEVTPTTAPVISSVKLDQETLPMKTGATATLSPVFTPTDCSEKTVTWASSNTAVATVDANGKVTAVGVGTAYITILTKDGGYTAQCVVTVTAPTPAAITLDQTGTITFQSAKVGYGEQTYQDVTITNTGDLATGPLTIALSGSDADKFELVANINNIPGGDKATFQVRPKTGSQVGTYTATVTVTNGSLRESFDISFTVETASKPSSGGGSSTTYYPVNIPADSEGGSVAVSPKSASRGSTVTVTVTPDSGYQVDQVQAVDKDGNKLTLTDKGDGKYTFVMPSGKVEVSASFSKVQQPENVPYRDVSKDSYYYDAVQWATDKGITNGVAEGLFAPDGLCTRGQIVTFLWRSVGSPAPKTAEMPFVDVAENAYYAQAVLWAVENGITKGTSETTFSPEQTCTRAHAVAFLYRLAGSPAVTGSSFQDVEADAYYSAAVAWAVQKGITNGTSETTFSPDQTCTRAQIVTFLYRMDQAK